jgi:hypothetical protein
MLPPVWRLLMSVARAGLRSYPLVHSASGQCAGSSPVSSHPQPLVLSQLPKPIVCGGVRRCASVTWPPDAGVGQGEPGPVADMTSCRVPPSLTSLMPRVAMALRIWA